jgi:hypothetical protein
MTAIDQLLRDFVKRENLPFVVAIAPATARSLQASVRVGPRGHRVESLMSCVPASFRIRPASYKRLDG